MLDRFIRPFLEPVLTRCSKRLDQCHISPMAVTFTGLSCGLGIIPALAFEWYDLALLLLICNRLFDGLDGALARYQNDVTDRGGYFDIVSDFLVYAGFAFGFALANAQNALPSAFVLFAFMGTASTFLAYAIMVAKKERNLPLEQKTFYYLGGLTEGSETILWMISCCCWPHYFPLLAWGFGGLCWLTTMSRLWIGWWTLTGGNDSS